MEFCNMLGFYAGEDGSQLNVRLCLLSVTANSIRRKEKKMGKTCGKITCGNIVHTDLS
jgi:hypothetical protein